MPLHLYKVTFDNVTTYVAAEALREASCAVASKDEIDFLGEMPEVREVSEAEAERKMVTEEDSGTKTPLWQLFLRVKNEPRGPHILGTTEGF